MPTAVLENPATLFAGAANLVAEKLKPILVAVRSRAGGGSGTIWSADGLVITNSHVVPGDEAEVVFGDDRVLPAKLIARDPERDLAALKVDAIGLPKAEAADSDAVRVGQLVFAIGNPWGMRGTVTAGIIAGKGAVTTEGGLQLDNIIRADVRLAPGNSGGPLADAEGRVIGINAMIAGGLALAVPSRFVEQFAGGDVPGRAFLGIRGRPVPLPEAIAASFHSEDGGGLLITDVEPASPASLAGILPGDVLLRLEGAPAGVRSTARALQRMRPGHRLRIDLLRGGRLEETTAEPVARV
ncbi:MAG: trypsin-like peptidase domain-containing protein [Chloroflexi bacterium]|nr:trypsin-like peptidase domain-containing protein [Chloroflexota bacterium]